VICAKKDKSEMIKQAGELQVPLMLEDWVTASIEEGDLLDEGDYLTFPVRYDFEGTPLTSFTYKELEENKGKQKAKPKSK